MNSSGVCRALVFGHVLHPGGHVGPVRKREAMSKRYSRVLPWLALLPADPAPEPVTGPAGRGERCTTVLSRVASSSPGTEP